MGRGRDTKSRTMRKHFRDGREDSWKKSKPNSPPKDEEHKTTNPTWQPFATQNKAFDEYYKGQHIVSTEEWDKFMEVLRSPLPASFRINSCGQFCDDIKLQLENDFSISLQSETKDGVDVEGLRPLLWYPDKLAWHSNFSRMQLRKNQYLERFHEFLKMENEIGNITRQEAVSMVPPLFLDVNPDHFILDMCAAPGSKTFQLLEIMYQSMTPETLPEGMVIANDVDVQRCNLLIHQTKRMCTANLMVTNNEAQQFPSCRAKKGSSEEIDLDLKPSIGQLLFDRVLCDVPCSGDGTLRKAPDMWRKWNSGMGNGLHGLQLQIAMQGVSLLKVGGKMVYSTCSMNPVENEAVVAEVLRRCEGSIQLVDVSEKLPGLVRRPGLKRWKVWDKGVWLCSHESASKLRKYGSVPSMFPSGRRCSTSCVDQIENSDAKMVENSEDDEIEECELPLDRCMRIVPHDQNCGAFFIAVLEKVSPFKAPLQKQKKGEKSNGNACNPLKSSRNSVVPSEGPEEMPSSAQAVLSDPIVVDSDKEPNQSKNEVSQRDVKLNVEELPIKNKERTSQMQGRWKGVDPIIFFKDADIIKSIKDFYGISPSFPLEGHLISRNIDNNSVKRLYYISPSVKSVLELNVLSGHQLKISSVGLKMFERQSAIKGDTGACRFRVSSEGLAVILPHMTKQIIYASYGDLKLILTAKCVKFSEFGDSEFGEAACSLSLGCCVVVLKDGGEVPVKIEASTIAIGCWKGRGSLSVMVTAIDCKQLLQRLALRFEGACSLEPNSNGNSD